MNRACENFGGGAPERPRSLPADWGAADERRRRDTAELLERVAGLRRTYADVPAGKLRSLIERRCGRWARARGLSVHRDALRRYGRRLPLDGNIDRRGCCGGRSRKVASAAWSRFLVALRDGEARSAAAAWRIVAAEAESAGWVWYCSPRGAQHRLREARRGGDGNAVAASVLRFSMN